MQKLQIFEPTEKYIQENSDKLLEQVKAFYNGDLIHYAVLITSTEGEKKEEALQSFADWRHDFEVVMFTSELLKAFGHLTIKDKMEYFKEMFQNFEEKESDNGPLEFIKSISKQEIIDQLESIKDVVEELNTDNLEKAKIAISKTIEQRIKRLEDSHLVDRYEDESKMYYI